MDRVDEVLAAAHAAGCERVITYSLSDDAADVFAGGLRRTNRGIVACVRTPRFTEDILVATPVKFNVSNALGAIACAEGLGIEREAIVHGFERLRVPGRMELYPSADGAHLGVVDFAHNGMSLETMLRDLRENYPDRELAVVFGATGGKGVDRRDHGRGCWEVRRPDRYYRGRSRSGGPEGYLRHHRALRRGRGQYELADRGENRTERSNRRARRPAVLSSSLRARAEPGCCVVMAPSPARPTGRCSSARSPSSPDAPGGSVRRMVPPHVAYEACSPGLPGRAGLTNFRGHVAVRVAGGGMWDVSLSSAPRCLF